MSEKINDGGSAFPILPPICGDGHPPAGYPYPQSGMSLRDWFAGMALQGHLAYLGSCLYTNDAAELAYRYADAMIAVRKGGAK